MWRIRIEDRGKKVPIPVKLRAKMLHLRKLLLKATPSLSKYKSF